MGWVIAFLLLCFVQRSELLTADLNEIGDFLGGFFAPLAFLWFVITVLLQRGELQLTRDEMKRTRKELNRQSVAMEGTLEIDRQQKIRTDI
ncbi:unnamed protein product, partial [Chrysoparadoxa australica]